ncbi:MAG TPA: sigma-70 family RNA polymerase sigma factor [Thermoanaerobaculia bacterium]|nr:sigma-70 family RNA polymerase sigma factor [Thermoanaerobaculia bacterium]HUM30846.1 sigma-70 family RNA polymerase sigma factor [Thermoanaerobaculia bacterium]HXK69173.1 sigma-70 family RNA polymerase sigma factor [Thermoanaerobaculia bacterium]
MLRDEDLVRLALEGSPAAFNVLVERYQVRLTRFLMHRVGNPHDAEELAQEAFLKTYMALDRFDPQYRFSTWVYRIAINLSIDHLRKNQAGKMELNPEQPDPLSDASDLLETKERFHEFMHALRQLPEEFRLLIEMRHFLEMSYNDMAETLDLPLGTVKNRLFRARQALLALVEENHESVQ